MNSNNNCSCPTGVVGTGCHTANVATAPFLRKSKTARLLLSLALVFGVMLFVNATSVNATSGNATSALVLTHGVTIQKNCVSPVTVCDTDADCSGAVGDCQQNHCDTSGQHTTDCSITVTNADTFGDTIHIVSNTDTLNTGGGPVTNNNLSIIAVSGNTTCVVGAFPALGCNIGSPSSPGGAGSVTFQDSGYNPTAADSSPLEDTATVRVQDMCDAVGTIGCNPNAVNVSFGAATTLVSGCSVVNKDNSTACGTDDTPGDCKTPGCEEGVCVQTHNNVANSTACGTDSTPGDCKTPGCEEGVCVQTHNNVANSTACTSTDDITGDCGTPGCEEGVCVATHIPVGDSTPCTSTDDITGDCRTPGCESGACVATHNNEADSTPCTDTDGQTCTTSGCEAGSCVQTHVDDCEHGQGCTPGFWKANADKKGANAWPVSPNTLLSSVFTIPPCLSGCPENYNTITLREALSLQGGKTLCQKAEILLRAAAAAYLNSLSTCVQYPISTGTLVTEVNTALASCDSGAIITEATRLDGFNNLGCPLNQQGDCSNP